MLKPKFNEKLTLIETDYFEYLTEDNGELVWKKIKIEGLPFIPVIITTNSFKKDNKIFYTIIYELPYTHEYITTNSEETFITEKDEEGKSLHTTQIKMPNKKYSTSIDSPIRLDNQNIDILKKLMSKSNTPIEYISKKRKEIFKLNKILDDSTSLIMNKVFKKETPK
ncbi:MAG: hypothetical protein IKG40_00700 [Bacilli bacterium]|nr:hypothetical protein [Bacilli bacterium]